MNYSIPEPSPIITDELSIHDLLIESLNKDHPLIQDVLDRKQFGLDKYGTILQESNGRDHKVEIVQELLDAWIYTHLGIVRGDKSLYSLFWQLERMLIDLIGNKPREVLEN